MAGKKYTIDFVYDNPSGENYYHQLVRNSDGAILYANPILDNIFVFCFKAGINREDVAIL